MIAWIIFLGGSAAIGCICAMLIKKSGISFIASVLLPVLIIPFSEYVLPYQGGGASMWPIALIFGGIPAAFSGLLGWAMWNEVLSKKK